MTRWGGCNKNIKGEGLDILKAKAINLLPQWIYYALLPFKKPILLSKNTVKVTVLISRRIIAVIIIKRVFLLSNYANIKNLHYICSYIMFQDVIAIVHTTFYYPIIYASYLQVISRRQSGFKLSPEKIRNAIGLVNWTKRAKKHARLNNWAL
jgi:hypothetical protein